MGCFATEENTEDDNPPIGINYSRRRFKMKSVTRYFRNAVAASMQGTVNYKKERFFVVTEGELLSGKLVKRIILIYGRRSMMQRAIMMKKN